MNAQQTSGLDTSVFDRVIESGDAEARIRLAEQLADLLSDVEAPRGERRAVVPALLKLAADDAPEVRRALADKLKPIRTLEADLLFAIVADEDDIALPFLSETAALDPWRMLAVLQVGDVARQLVIASRADIAPEAVAEIAAKGSVEVAAALLDNPACHIPGADYRRLYTRFRDEAAVVDRLLDRSDLPLEVRLLQARRASTRVQALVTERGWVAANDAESIVADVQETTVIRILEQGGPEELDRLIPFMGERDMLNGAIVVRAACRGQMPIVARSLAWLSSMSLKHVNGVIDGHNRIPLKAVLSAAGIPGGAHMLLRAAVETWREAKQAGAPVPPEQFSRLVVEALMTRYDGLAGPERLRLLDLVSRLTDERTKAIATRLITTLREAA